MPITLDIPEELLIRAETYALAYGKDLESLLLDILTESLSELPPPPTISREERRAYGQARMRQLAAEAGMNWDTMDDEAREAFLMTLTES